MEWQCPYNQEIFATTTEYEYVGAAVGGVKHARLPRFRAFLTSELKCPCGFLKLP